MGKKSPSPPPSPDPVATAAAQSAANIDTAIAQGYMNRMNQTTPFGTMRFNKTGTTDVSGHAVPTFEQIMELSPNQQALQTGTEEIGRGLLDIGNDRLSFIRNNLENPLDFSGLTKTLFEDAGANPRQAVEDALYARSTSRLDPEWEKERNRFETQLSNQGFSRGTDAYNDALDQFTRGKNDAYASARQLAIAGGGAEESREAGLRMADRTQAIQEMLGLRAQPINELQALLGLTPGVTMPQFQAPPQTAVSPTDIAGITLGSAGIDAANWRAAQEAKASQNAGMFGMAGMLGAGALMSPWAGAAIMAF